VGSGPKDPAFSFGEIYGRHSPYLKVSVQQEDHDYDQESG
jgi:hypothetical protein